MSETEEGRAWAETRVKQLTGGDNARHLSQTLAQLDQASRQLNEAGKALQPALARLPGLTRQLGQTLTGIDRLTRQAIPAIRKASQSAQGIGASGHPAVTQHEQRLAAAVPHGDRARTETYVYHGREEHGASPGG